MCTVLGLSTHPTISEDAVDELSMGTRHSTEDRHWMDEALSLARSMQGSVWPNPPVGCIIVNNGKVVGRGKTQPGGRPHAERVALDDAGEAARGATLYVTLEPCCHWGKTPPCADAIIAAGVTRVFASIQDPDPRVNGGGFAKLREAGIQVDVGLGQREAHKIMAGFLYRIATGRPLLAIGSPLKNHALIPDGFDACLYSDAAGVWLRLADHESHLVAGHIQSSAEAFTILQELGRQGLTSVFIAAEDKIESWFSGDIRESTL